MTKVPLEEAQKRLPELIEKAAAGSDIVISRADGADVRLVPVAEVQRRPRKAGTARGLIHIADDFDEPLEDFAPYT